MTDLRASRYSSIKNLVEGKMEDRMRAAALTISGFQCFDKTGQTITFDDLTCFVGPNASGKTAALVAFGRLFGETRTFRQVVPSDFHLRPDEELRATSPRELFIECRFEFPELADEDSDGGDAVPETFNQMIVEEPGGEPFCRVRLEATWTDDGTATGDVEQSTWWIRSESDDEKRKKLQPSERGRIRFIYVPAARDPAQQIRATATTAFGRLLGALSWDGADAALEEQLKALQAEVSRLSGIGTMNSSIQSAWSSLYDGRTARKVTLQAVDEGPEQVLAQLAPVFRPSEGGQSVPTSELTDGLRSLFSLSLTIGLHKVEEELRRNPGRAGFVQEVIERLPILTIFAVEEPENHLSPHYLGRITSVLGEHAQLPRAQILLSSHSPGILGRIEPDSVRYFQGHERTATSSVRPVPLPADETEEAFKYVREAVRGFPELYFSRLVVLGEGPSEEIVLRRLFEQSRTPLDEHFISIVPLGGRHVNHFWRLLRGLSIPYITLLDLDREKHGGCWQRVQYVRDQLVALHGKDSSLLEFSTENDEDSNLAADDWDDFSRFEITDNTQLEAWLRYFRDDFSVYFASPLDLDFSMLESFPEVYRSLALGSGPRLPEEETLEYSSEIEKRIGQVLGETSTEAESSVGSTYTESQRVLFPWYKYLFLDGSKPVAHMRALLRIPPDDLESMAPDVLRELAKKARALVVPQEV